MPGPMGTWSGVSPRSALSTASIGVLAVALLGILCFGSHGAVTTGAFATLGVIASGLVALRAVRVRAERLAWSTFAVALVANATTEVLELSGGAGAVAAASAVAGVLTFLLAIAALALRVRARLGRLRAIAWLDGMTGALVVQMILGLWILGPAAGRYVDAGHSAWSLTLLYPLADLVFVGIVVAATAETGWRLSGWTAIGLGLVLVTFGDSVAAAHRTHDGHWSMAVASVFWLAGMWALATSAWMPLRRASEEQLDLRAWAPVALSVATLALLLVSTLRSNTWPGAIGLAATGAVLVTIRFAITLRLNARLLRAARTEATTDALTGLRNRRRLVLDLETTLRACRPDRPAALGMFDLNGFKAYNDTFGHPAGDALLETLGNRLSAAVEGSATAYRMGGDEFCVLVAPGTEDLPGVIARAAQALSVTTRGQTVTTASGLALLPRDASTSSEALRLADLRMYEHKGGGRLGAADHVTRALMLTVEERNLGLPGTLDTLERLAAAVGAELGLPASELERIQLAALLRNVGRIAIPDSVLTKDGPLTDAEWRLVRRHTLVGQRIIESIPALVDVATLVRSIHERADGTGYPDQLTGEQIPLGSQIIAICNCYDAMISPRAYRAPLTEEQAIDQIRRGARRQFSAPVVDAFLRAIATYDRAGADQISAPAERPSAARARHG